MATDYVAVPTHSVEVDRLRRLLVDLFQVYDVTVVREGEVRFRGRLWVDSERAYDVIARRARALHYVPFFRRDGDDHVVIFVHGELPRAKTRPVLALILFLATVISVFFAGTLRSDGQTWLEVAEDAGFFAGTLLAILVAHEMGHYIVSQYYRTPVSLPYFIPAPIFLFGTMGAVIRMVAPPKNRRQWLHIAAAGPLAGLLFAVPLTFIGLLLSSVAPLPSGGGDIIKGNSILYMALKVLAFGRVLPSGGEDVFLHPMAWAGWGGLLVTALNLIPAAQLDGGHVARALLGRAGGRVLTYGIIAVLLALGTLWEGWFVWALIIFIFSRVEVEPLDDITEPNDADRLLAAFMLVLFILLFTPVPLKVVEPTAFLPRIFSLFPALSSL